MVTTRYMTSKSWLRPTGLSRVYSFPLLTCVRVQVSETCPRPRIGHAGLSAAGSVCHWRREHEAPEVPRRRRWTRMHHRPDPRRHTATGLVGWVCGKCIRLHATFTEADV